jgi:hypothetical protein
VAVSKLQAKKFNWVVPKQRIIHPSRLNCRFFSWSCV